MAPEILGIIIFQDANTIDVLVSTSLRSPIDIGIIELLI